MFCPNPARLRDTSGRAQHVVHRRLQSEYKRGLVLLELAASGPPWARLVRVAAILPTTASSSPTRSPKPPGSAHRTTASLRTTVLSKTVQAASQIQLVEKRDDFKKINVIGSYLNVRVRFFIFLDFFFAIWFNSCAKGVYIDVELTNSLIVRCFYYLSGLS